MDLDYKKYVGLINYELKPNNYTIKCEIYNKLTKMHLATYKNIWIKNDCVKNDYVKNVCVKNAWDSNEIYTLQLDTFTLTLQNKVLTMYTNELMPCDSQEYKYLLLILQTLNP